MPATNLNAADRGELGLSTEAELDAADVAHLDEISANDPFMADLLASMEQAKPTAEDLAKAMRGTPVEDDHDAPSDGSDVVAEAPAVIDPLAKPGEVSSSTAPASTGGPAPAAGADPSAAESGDPASTPTQLTDTFLVDIGNGATESIDSARARHLLSLEAWAGSLQQRPQLLNAMQAVESGQAVAIPSSQYEQFQVWLAGGQRGQAAAPNSQPAPAASQSAAPPLPELDEYADPATRALYASVQQTQHELATLRDQHATTLRNAEASALQSHLDARAAIFNTEFTAAANEYGLTPTEVNAALQHAANTLLIQSVNTELAARHPLTGAIVGESDPAAVARLTFERATYQLPALRDKLINSQVQSRLDSERASVTSINAKKTRAASLSSAPTAATTSNRDPRDMSLQEREAGIAAELRAAMSA